MNVIPSRVYVMQAGGAVKIGRSADPERRRKAIAGAHSGDVTLSYVTDVLPFASAVEAIVHDRLRHANTSGEWFDVPVSDAIEAIENAVTSVQRSGAPLYLVIKLPPALLDKLDCYCKSTGQSRTEVMETAIVQLCDQYDPPKGKRK
jgi:hypothetical protein